MSGHVVLSKDNVLYLGSAVPIETTVGVEAFQMPCRERYSNALDSCSNVEGIDTTVVIYNSGLLIQYNADPTGNGSWFPIQGLHACAAVKSAASPLGVQFVALDTQEALASAHAPLFCAIIRRTQGIKVLECHVFMCKSTESALTLVQSMTYAFEHPEGWKPDDAMPPVISLKALSGSGPAGPRILPANQAALRQKFSINQSQQQQAAAPTFMNNQNLSGNDQGGQAVVFIPGPPFYPEKKCKKKKKKIVVESDDDDDEELYICKRPDRYRQVPDDLVLYAPAQPLDYTPQIDPSTGYSYYGGPTAADMDAEALARAEYIYALQDYNSAIAAGVIPDQDFGYPDPYAAGAPGYGELVDGLGYYP